MITFLHWPATLWLNVSSDGLIAAAYYTILIGFRQTSHQAGTSGYD
jgi:hypothetical protein